MKATDQAIAAALALLQAVRDRLTPSQRAQLRVIADHGFAVTEVPR